MSDHAWCHGPTCHKEVTVDRVRGTKGNKVLRTRKIKIYDSQNMYNYFCSQHCYNVFANTYINEIIAIAPRNEPLETPIEDPKKTVVTSHWDPNRTWTETTITKVDNAG